MYCQSAGGKVETCVSSQAKQTGLKLTINNNFFFTSPVHGEVQKFKILSLNANGYNEQDTLSADSWC